MSLDFSDDRRLQSLNETNIYLYETSKGKICQEKLLEHVKTKEVNKKGD